MGVAVIVLHAWLCAVGVRESESRESFPRQTVLEVVPVGILAIGTAPADRSEADPLVAIAASPDTAPDAIAMAAEFAAVSLPYASTVNVATLEAEPYDAAVTVVVGSLDADSVPADKSDADPLVATLDSDGVPDRSAYAPDVATVANVGFPVTEDHDGAVTVSVTVVPDTATDPPTAANVIAPVALFRLATPLAPPSPAGPCGPAGPTPPETVADTVLEDTAADTAPADTVAVMGLVLIVASLKRAPHRSLDRSA